MKSINSLTPVFIIGHPKSGTSLVNSLLDSHPELMVLAEESDYYSSVWPKTKLLNYQWRLSRTKKIELIIDHIFVKTHFKNYLKGDVEKDVSGNLNYSDFPTSKLKKELSQNISESIKSTFFNRKNLFDAIINAYKNSIEEGEQNDWRYFVEKTPKHTWFLNEISQDYPNAKLIFVYRDPRDNYVSYLKKHGENMSAIRFSKSWTNAFSMVENIKHDLEIHTVKYEDLLSNSTKILEGITQFLNIEWNSILQKPTKRGNSWSGNSMFNYSSSTLHQESIGRFRKTISEEDLEVIEFLCGLKMKECGYEKESNNIPSSEAQIDMHEKFNFELPLHISKGFNTRRFLGLIKILLKGSR